MKGQAYGSAGFQSQSSEDKEPKLMRITYTMDDGNPRSFDRGNTKESREFAARFIQQRVRCRYTPQSKQRAKDFARSQA